MKKEITKIINNIKIGITTLPFVFWGCKMMADYEKFDKGEVYEKIYDSARYYEDSYIIEGITIPYTEYDDEDYIIKIRKWNDKLKGYHTLNLKITKEEYDTLEVGDTFNLKPPIRYLYY